MKLKMEDKPRPFVKWVGGKTQLLGQLTALLPKDGFNKYFEPFVGGGAVYFNLEPKKAHINDINATLINTYIRIRDELPKLIKILKAIEDEYLFLNTNDKKAYYYEARDRYNKLSPDVFDKSILFLFLNRTGYNGMYRENTKGHFNIPMGSYKNPKILNKEKLEAISRLLQKTKITAVPFEQAVKNAKLGDFVYFDPPYHPISPTSSFTGYNENSFNVDDQIRLRDVFADLTKRGVKVMLSNSNSDFIKSIYSNYKQIPVKANRMINARASGRGKITELVIINYEL